MGGLGFGKRLSMISSFVPGNKINKIIVVN